MTERSVTTTSILQVKEKGNRVSRLYMSCTLFKGPPSATGHCQPRKSTASLLTSYESEKVTTTNIYPFYIYLTCSVAGALFWLMAY